MKRPLVHLLLCLLVIPPCRVVQAEDHAPPPARAEIEPLQQVVRDQRIETRASRPGVALYLRDVAVAVGDGIAELIARFFPDVGILTSRIARIGALVVIAVAVFLLGIFLLRLALRRWRARPEEPTSPIRVLPQPQRSDLRSQERWEAELDRQLARGDVAAALAALWWWLACGLLPRAVDPSWTTRELISRAGRWDLAAWVRRLDRMIYGAEPPAVDEVRRFWGDLREVLG